MENVQQNCDTKISRLEHKCTISTVDSHSCRWHFLIRREISFSTKRNDDFVPARNLSCFHLALHLLCGTWEYFEPRRREKLKFLSTAEQFGPCEYITPQCSTIHEQALNQMSVVAPTRTLLPWRCSSDHFQHTQYSRSNIMEQRLYTFLPPVSIK